jgi:membrane protease YdiL (CAAX protease family)
MSTGAPAHILFLLVLLGPWLYLPIFRRQSAEISAGRPNARVALYKLMLAKQIVVVALLLLLHAAGGVSTASLGWVAPQSWSRTLVVGVAVVAAVFYFSARIDPKTAAATLAKIKQKPVGVLIPETNRERLWIGWLSIGAGIMEEMLCRGFLFYYLATYLRVTNPVLIVVASAALFGLGHIYQGWKSAAGPAVAGVVLGSIYLYTGSLVLPIIVHAVGDYRLLWVLPKTKTRPPEDHVSQGGNPGLSAKSG